MNHQQVPGPLGEHGVFDTLNGSVIRWTDRRGLTHHVVGADVHPGIRLLWTRCEIDVPADTAWLPKGPCSYEVCMICMKRAMPTALGGGEPARIASDEARTEGKGA